MRLHCQCLTFLLFMLPTTGMANAQQDYWQCSSMDDHDKIWTSRHSFQKVALQRAWQACKQESQHPSSCQIDHYQCDAFLNGENTSPMWQCTALDQMAKPWISGVHRQRDEAALTAKARCLERSGFPDTCYINLLTCVNLNERE